MKKIAVTYENGEIFQHFGRTPQFLIYEFYDDGYRTSVVDTNGTGHGALAGFLKDLDVDTVICGGVGQGMLMNLQSMGISCYGGVQGSAEEAVEKFIRGELEYDPDVHCDCDHDHDHEDHHHCH